MVVVVPLFSTRHLKGGKLALSQIANSNNTSVEDHMEE